MHTHQTRELLLSAKLLEDRAVSCRTKVGALTGCRVRLYKIHCGIYCPGHYVLIATDLGFEGVTVTSIIESVVEEVARLWELEPKQLLVFEHYDRRTQPRDVCEPSETFARVSFTWNGVVPSEPKWSPARRCEVQAMIGGQTIW